MDMIAPKLTTITHRLRAMEANAATGAIYSMSSSGPADEELASVTVP